MIPNYSETDTRVKLINPELYKRGWTEDNIRREVNAGEIYLVDGRPRRGQQSADYVLAVKVGDAKEMVRVAVIEAKRNWLPPHHGLDQGKQYADTSRLNVPFVYSSNGYQWVEFDASTGNTSREHLMSQFPTPEELRERYEAHVGFSLDDEAAKPMLTPYTGGDSVRRYYQDAAIRAVLEGIAAGRNRMLLSLATGTGKTRIAVHLLKRIADAGQLHRVLFVCDRTELRDQATAAFQNVFGNDAQPVSTLNARKNARILIATYQTLDVDTEDEDANFFLENYPENYFSHIVIDECHRSAWGQWSIVLTNNAQAIQIGLTATPRQLPIKTDTPEAQADAQITADNLEYFGEPVYEYDMGQAITDGYLAACEIHKGRVNIDDTGISVDEVIARRPRNPITGQVIREAQVRQMYEAAIFGQRDYERLLLLPDRVWAMSNDLFQYLLDTGGPEQKTILFCASDNHADRVAAAMQNLYANWCADNDCRPKDYFAFKCTAKSSGNDMLPDLRASTTSYFVATTVDLLSTGVDVPCIENIVFFRYLKSPIYFHQMLGRGTRLYAPENKMVFRVYDYTDATDLLGEEFLTPGRKETTEGPEPDEPPEPPDEVSVKSMIVEGFDVHVTPTGDYMVIQEEGETRRVTLEEYKQRIAARLVDEAPDLTAFRDLWIQPEARHGLLNSLPAQERSALIIQYLANMQDYDLFDVLGELGYGLAPLTREDRAGAFAYKHENWLEALPQDAAATIRALTEQFAQGGTDELESPYIFDVPAVRQAGGIPALQAAGRPADVLQDTKARMFAA